jgi:hypothetical protein
MIEAARILLTASSHRGLLPEDRTDSFAWSLPAPLGQPEAERRVDDVIARAKENISRARKSAVILASVPALRPQVRPLLCHRRQRLLAVYSPGHLVVRPW